MGGLGHRESEVGPAGLGEKLPLPANLAMGKNCASLLDNAPNYLVGYVIQKRNRRQPKIIDQSNHRFNFINISIILSLLQILDEAEKILINIEIWTRRVCYHCRHLD